LVALRYDDDDDVLTGLRPRQVFTAAATPFRLWLCEPLAANRV
jgi:hypothetical protein